MRKKKILERLVAAWNQRGLGEVLNLTDMNRKMSALAQRLLYGVSAQYGV